MNNWIWMELDALANGQQTRIRSYVLSIVSMGLTFIVTKLSLSRLATPDEILSWSTLFSGMIVTAGVHFLDKHIGNANIAATGPAPQQAAPPPLAQTPPAVAAPAAPPVSSAK